MTKKIQIMETALRDAHQSLFATRMLTEDMIPILEKMDSVGYYSLEAWGGATFDVCMRYLLEDPWQRLRTIRKHVKKTRLQMLLRGQNVVGYRHYADDVLRKFIDKAKENGVDIFRIFDALNDPRNLDLAVKTTKKSGGTVEGSISYTTSPVHNVEAFVKFALQLKDMGSDVICVKDMAGLLSPMDAFDLVKALKEQVKLPVHLHCHSASGMAPMSYLAACEAGVDILDTAVSPLSGGTSQPATEAIVGALKGSSFDTGLDIALLAEIGDYFETIKDRYCQLIDPLAFRVDSRLFIHQIPGGMMSNLISQLKEQNAMDKFQQVLEETGRVRKDMGYPPLVTPTSQIVGTQAVLNVLSKSRYKVVSKQTKDYVRGLYGKSPAPIPADIVKACVGNDKLITSRPADDLQPELEKARTELAGVVDTDEDVLSYVLFPQVALDFFKARKQGRGPVRACVPPPEKPAPVNTKVLHDAPQVSIAPNGAGYEVSLGDKSYTIGVQRGRPSNGATPLTLVIDGQAVSVQIRPSEASPRKPVGQVAVSPAAPAPPVPQPQQATPAAAPAATPAAALVAPAALPSTAPARETRKMSEAAPPRGSICAPMPGKVISVSVKPGERVVKGQRLFILEAMKMENEIDSPFAGNVEAVNAQPGMTVSNTNQPLVMIKPD